MYIFVLHRPTIMLLITSNFGGRGKWRTRQPCTDPRFSGLQSGGLVDIQVPTAGEAARLIARPLWTDEHNTGCLASTARLRESYIRGRGLPGSSIDTIIIITIIIIIIQHLYSGLKSCKGYGGADGFRLRLSEQVCFEVFLKVCKVWQDLMSDGSEFQVCGAATEKARRANSVRVLAADSSGAWQSHSPWSSLSDSGLNVAAGRSGHGALYSSRC